MNTPSSYFDAGNYAISAFWTPRVRTVPSFCHTWYWVKGGQGNVPFKGRLPSSNVWDGETPPPNSDPGCGTDMFTGRPGTY